MSTATLLAEVPAAPARFLDFDVSCIPEYWQQQLARWCADWLASADFVLGHLFPPAQRIWICVDEAGILRHAYYYNEEHSLLGKRITLHGPAELNLAEARALLQARNAVRLDVLRMFRPAFSLSDDHGSSAGTLYGEDFIVGLPHSEEELLKSFGHNKRQQLGKYTRRLERQWPGAVEWICLSGDEIGKEMFSTVAQFNSWRQSAKGKRALWQEAMTNQRWQLARRTGLLCGIRLGGEFVAGGVAYVYPQDAYFALIGHDPKYDYWNLGNLTTWLILRKSLERGVRRFHFLWGLSEYKLRFGGKVQPLFTISVYRNYPVRLVSSFLDTAPAWKSKILRAARDVHMSLRNSQFGRLLSGLWPQPNGLRSPRPE